MFHVLTLTYQKPLDVVDQTRPAHVEWINKEISAGRLLLAGRQESQQGGVLITGDIPVEAADELIANDPYTLAGLVTYQRVGFQAALRAPGL
ncbi:YciI family protein [Mycolicibacterium mengxianglii]|uniref:YciI family protein n=1 Tax=Mycolicibacterium mengxianglii TaxID=2736649 RepID=UPI0018D07FF8|nr:YciI family protein [Mycolicibacterium mengxianglii]